MDLKSLIVLFQQIFETQSLILAVLSAPFNTSDCQKVTLRPLLIKGELFYQATEQRNAQAIHHNLSKEECLNWIRERLETYKQSFVYTESADYQILISKKRKMTLLTKPPTKSSAPLQHNRLKQYLLQEGTPIPFLVHLGVMTPEGKVIAKKSDKFRQINRFLEMIDDVIPHLEAKQQIRIVDFGCGKAYLTFALYHYLKFVKKLNFELIGLDLKVEVIQLCEHLALQLGYAQDLHFQLGDINTYKTEQPVDMVICLHACDTATDAALEKAIQWQAKVILCVPCCQHELYHQIQNQALTPLLKHGILKERFAALATDALRAQLLEVSGYHTQVLEFIEMEHTPKNLLIRAVKSAKPENTAKKRQAYLEMKQALQVEPSLEKRLKTHLTQND
ncbi:MAG: class I SAM-dependent methyltransferase [Chlamydiales bacterium]